MLWFNGSIRNAVDKVKSSGSFLLVFVQGNDSLSEKYEAYLNEKAVFNLDDYVAIKIPYDSHALQQFKQIYVSVPVPSVFLIQNNGIPLKVVSSTDISEVHTAISDALNKQKLKQEKKEKMFSNKNSFSGNSIKRNENISAELTRERVKNIGRKLFDISEEELKTRLKEIRAFPKFLLIDSLKNCDPISRSVLRSKTQSARIQFRLPNNSMPSWEFPELCTLADVKSYIIEKMKLSPNFKFLRTYPRYAFTREDEHKTLAALALTPSAILIVVPYEDKTVQAKVTDLLVHQNFLSILVNTVLKPFFGIFDYIKNYFFKSRQKNEPPTRLSGIRSIERRVNRKVLTPGSNIHGFKFHDDSDTEKEHPDNGNSTQQRFQ